MVLVLIFNFYNKNVFRFKKFTHYNSVAADFLSDTDGDGILDDGDNSGIVFDNPCTGDETIGCDDNCLYVYNPEQIDLNGDGNGDVCECESDFDGDGAVAANDVTTFLNDLGRNQYNNPCTAENPCNGDFDGDGAVGSNDVTKFLEDFGRNKWISPCPPCFFGLVELPPPPPIEPPDPRFIDHGDSTVTDSLTGLMWTKDTQQIPWKYRWDMALNLCEDLIYPTTDGYEDWRMPSLEELQSLIDSNNHNPVLPLNHPFQNVLPFLYWTSTPYENVHEEHVCYVLMSTGDSYYHCKVAYGFIWPVRDAQF